VTSGSIAFDVDAFAVGPLRLPNTWDTQSRMRSPPEQVDFQTALLPGRAVAPAGGPLSVRER
jgi:hypothetical protein